jgi:hypothetical protein
LSEAIATVAFSEKGNDNTNEKHIIIKANLKL